MWAMSVCRVMSLPKYGKREDRKRYAHGRLVSQYNQRMDVTFMTSRAADGYLTELTAARDHG